MSGLQDKTMGDKPWLVTGKPEYRSAPHIPPHIPDDAVEEGGFWYWIMEDAEKPYVMCTGGASAPYTATGWWPDKIWDRMKVLDPTLQ